jgi:hypothetical protein
LSLHEISKQFERTIRRFLLTNKLDLRRYVQSSAEASHQCTSYRKEEIILAPIAAKSATVTSLTPRLHEICFVCGKEVDPRRTSRELGGGGHAATTDDKVDIGDGGRVAAGSPTNGEVDIMKTSGGGGNWVTTPSVISRTRSHDTFPAGTRVCFWGSKRQIMYGVVIMMKSSGMPRVSPLFWSSCNRNDDGIVRTLGELPPSNQRRS